MLAVAKTYALVGAEAVAVDAEVDIHRGLPAFSVVGLPDAAVRESRERVRAAIVNSGFEFPLKRVTVSLAPADLRKAGPGYDLAIATAILVASGQLPASLLEAWSLAGELALDGSLRPVRGAVAIAEAARKRPRPAIVVPRDNAADAAFVGGLLHAPLARLSELRGLADGEIPAAPDPARPARSPAQLPDLEDLRGQPALRRALEVAAAGVHSVFISGPPGAGKSLAARRLPSLLPPLDAEEAIEVRRIASIAGNDSGGARPFRAPHHTISAAGLVGGGAPLRPGEITLAHRGVLFLDELGEFSRQALEALRQPIETGEVQIARAAGSIRFPADFQLAAAANPCPCGHGEGSEHCRCTPQGVRRYAARLSGALADRIDIHVAILQPDAAALGGDGGEASAAVRERVCAAHEFARDRPAAAGCLPRPGLRSGPTGGPDVEPEALAALEAGQRRLGLSGRGWSRALRVARTCADLDAAGSVGEPHVAEALALRSRLGVG